MATQGDDEQVDGQAARTPLSRERILRAAVAMADEHGIDAVSMRKLGQELGVDPMSLYNHVANKDALFDGMVDLVVGEIAVGDIAAADPGTGGDDGWKASLRARILAARDVMLRHQWAARVLETRQAASPRIMRYHEEVAATLRGGGFSVDLFHHALHTLGSRMLGFTQELFDDSATMAQGPEVLELMARQMSDEYPTLGEMMLRISHDESTVVGSGCDDQFEFTFALDLILDGLERLRGTA
jgi:AcrR family transcriptional regulator